MQQALTRAQAGSPPRRRFRRWALAAAAIAALAAVAVLLVATGVFGPDGGSGAKTAPTATATVARRDLVQRQTVSGTLGYADSRVVLNYRRGTITSLPAAGRVLRRGAVLYRVDERPTVLFAGSEPVWRPLALGVSEGRDVRQLEQNLRALGYDAAHEMTLDRHFSSATAAAAARWQADVGLPPTGGVALGDVVFLPGTRRVGTVRATLGERARPGAPVMTTTSPGRLVTAAIDASDQRDIAIGDTVVVDLLNGRTTAGKINDIDQVATLVKEQGGTTGAGGATSMITFTVRLEKARAAGQLDQAPVEVGVTSELVKDALSVPITALLALRSGRYGIEVVRGQSTTVVAVSPGLYSDGGYVEISGGAVRPGERVVVSA